MWKFTLQMTLLVLYKFELPTVQMETSIEQIARGHKLKLILATTSSGSLSDDKLQSNLNRISSECLSIK